MSAVDLLGNPGEPVPLILDDPLVHVDPERTKRLLEVLGQLAAGRRIFYVTQDERIAEWLGADGRNPEVRIQNPEGATDASYIRRTYSGF
jgi:uncharacterized protein YhaN